MNGYRFTIPDPFTSFVPENRQALGTGEAILLSNHFDKG